jgi:hypothetical protein
MFICDVSLGVPPLAPEEDMKHIVLAVQMYVYL